MADEAKKQLDELQKITDHLAKINQNNKTIKEITKKDAKLNRVDSIRAFKKSLKADKIDDGIVSLIDKVKPEKEKLTSKSMFDVFADVLKITAVDELEPLSKIQIITQENILAQSITSSLWLRDIFFTLGNMSANIDKLTDHFTGFATFEFSQRRKQEEIQRIQEERNSLIEAQTEKLGALLETKQAVVSPEEQTKGFLSNLFEGGILKKIGGAFASVFAFFKIGNLISFFKNLRVVKTLGTLITKSGGILGMILKGMLGALGTAFAFVGGFNIGVKISEFIDEQMGLGKGSIGVWLFDIIHSEEGLFGTIFRIIGDLATGLKEGILEFAPKVKEFMVQTFGFIFDPLINTFTEFYKVFEPDIIRFKETIVSFFTDIGDFVGNTSFEIVEFFSGLIDGILLVKDDIVNKLIEVKDRISGFIKDPVGFVKNLLEGETAPVDVKSEVEERGAMLLQRLEAREKFEAIRNRSITELAKKEALIGAISPTGEAQTINNSVISAPTTVLAPSDMDTDIFENTWKQLQMAN
jgi:hypothetical protein